MSSYLPQLFSSFAWLIFASEEHCDKAFEVISKQSVNGKQLTVDFCGVKSKHPPKQTDRNQQPINPLELYVSGFPASTSKDQIKVLFRSATSVTFPPAAKAKNKLFCFVKFDNVKDARAAFEKGKMLKIGGAPVDVLYARLKKGRCWC
ncbi:unnamed protein product [Toxocara canis]|uniref:RRM domain-containing protein n=1 Tax=Toxocara canis TaxID=6265 RepID=A0A3P7FVU8_TOXCA|nr:unnamed protein product [Toxocara canis]